MFKLIEKIRKKPPHVKQKIVVLVSVAAATFVLLIWGAGLLMRFVFS